MMNVGRLGTFIRDQRMGAKLSLRKLSGLAGVSIPYLSQVERGLRKPSAEILQAIAKALRISAEQLYVQAGFLEDRPASDVSTAILADLFITESQKKALLQIYEAFREEAGREGSATTPPRSRRAPSKSAPTSTTTRRPARAAGAPGSTRASTRKLGGGTASTAGSSPHPAPTRSPATTS